MSIRLFFVRCFCTLFCWLCLKALVPLVLPSSFPLFASSTIFSFLWKSLVSPVFWQGLVPVLLPLSLCTPIFTFSFHQEYPLACWTACNSAMATYCNLLCCFNLFLSSASFLLKIVSACVGCLGLSSLISSYDDCLRYLPCLPFIQSQIYSILTLYIWTIYNFQQPLPNPLPLFGFHP